MVASLIGRTNRVLYLAMSPDGAPIVTAQGMTRLNQIPSHNVHTWTGLVRD